MASSIPRVSVVIPTRNRRDLLISALTSVLRQTFQDFEIIVVDDCSEDDPQKIVKEMDNSKIRCISHEVQKGEAVARNTGIKNARGELIAFLDDDDEWFPEKLALQVELLEKSGNHVGGVYTGYWVVNLENKEPLLQIIPEKRGDIYKSLLRDNVIGTPSTVMLRKQVIERIGLFDDNLAYYVDYDFFIRISKHYNFENIKLPLAIYHIHQDMLSRDPDIMLDGLIDFRKKYSKRKDERLSTKYIGEAYYKIGMIYCNNCYFQKGRKILYKSLIFNPLQLKTFLYFLSVTLGKEYFLKMKIIIKNIALFKKKLTFARKNIL